MADLRDCHTRLEFHKLISKLASYAATEIGRNGAFQIRMRDSLQEAQIAIGQTSEMKLLIVGDVPPPFDGIVDIRNSIQRSAILDNVLTPQELRQIANFLAASRNLKLYFHQRSEKAPLLNSIACTLFSDKVLEYNLNDAIDDLGEIRDDASAELRTVRRQIVNLQEHLRTRLMVILRSAISEGWAQEDLVTTRDGRLVLPIKVEHKHQLSGFIHSISSSGATVFMEPAETLELNNDIASLRFKEMREIDRILRELTKQVGDARDRIQQNIYLIEQLDVALAKAKHSIAIDGHECALTGERLLVLRNARHPLLLETLPKGAVVALDIILGQDFHTMIITGPNAGGKTVALKTVGLMCLMALSGLHIPADPDSTIPFLRNIFVDIGDDQSIEENLSTFSSQLKILKEIGEQAGPDSLILIDELVSGTDPAEGGALGAAFLLKYTELQALTIITTHNGFLKTFALSGSGIENASMEFDQQSFTSTFKLKIGIAGSSYALTIAKRLGLDHVILANARNLLKEESLRLENSLMKLEEDHNVLRVQLDSVRDQTQRVEKLTREYEQKLQAQKEQEKEIRRKSMAEARELVRQASRQVEGLIEELRQSQATAESVGKVRREIRLMEQEIGRELRTQSKNSTTDETNFEVGDRVKLIDSDQVAEIIEKDGGMATVLAGTIKLRVDTNMLIAADSQSQIKPVRSTQSPLDETAAQRKVDVRGLRVEEAIQVVDKFIDDALLKGLHQIEIIHGRGTGALRKKIMEILKNHKEVNSFHFADWSGGGDGVTIVELK